MTQYIAYGVKTDCTTLLEKFLATDCVRFTEFVKIWKEMKFSCIYCGRGSFAELYEFTEEVLKIAKEFFLPPNPFPTRLCGLYLLYGLYNKQPTVEDGQFFVKIRINLKEWEESCSLMELVREKHHYDALFIFNKLIVDDAFHFCAMPREYGLEKNYRKYLEGQNTGEEVLPKSELLFLEENGILSSLDEVGKKYYAMKCALSNDNKQNVPNKLLNYTSADIAGDLRKIMAPLLGNLTTEELENSSEDIGARRRRLKEIACFGEGSSHMS